MRPNTKQLLVFGMGQQGLRGEGEKEGGLRAREHLCKGNTCAKQH